MNYFWPAAAGPSRDLHTRAKGCRTDGSEATARSHVQAGWLLGSFQPGTSTAFWVFLAVLWSCKGLFQAAERPRQPGSSHSRRALRSPLAVAIECLCKGTAWARFHLRAGSVLACALNHSRFGRWVRNEPSRTRGAAGRLPWGPRPRAQAAPPTARPPWARAWLQAGGSVSAVACRQRGKPWLRPERELGGSKREPRFTRVLANVHDPTRGWAAPPPCREMYPRFPAATCSRHE